MSESEEFIFNNAYCERVKRFRGETNMSAEEMANLLGIPPDRYRKYENRSPMPVYLIPNFCRIVGCDLEHLILGKPRERLKPVLIARKTGHDDADRAERVEALSPKRQQVARAIAETGDERLGTNRKKGIRGS
ncbi:MAG: helix-turn-helix transcriptional regulator [Shinella sp.]|nr:helix-turn-helix transcriptional regulator [Shinella sp.]